MPRSWPPHRAIPTNRQIRSGHRTWFPTSRRSGTADGTEAHERVDRATASEGWIRGNLARDRASADPRACHPHLPVPILQHSFRLDGSDVAGRRLPVSLEIQLRLFPLLAALL